MAEIDPSIALQAGRTQNQFDPLALAQLANQRRALLNQEAVQRQSLEAEQQKLTRQQQQQALMAGGGTPQEIQQRLIQGGFPTEAGELQKQQLGNRNLELEGHGKALNLIQEGASGIIGNPTEQNGLAILTRMEQLTGHNLDAEKSQLMSLRGDPNAIRQWATRQALTAKEQMPQAFESQLGGTVERGMLDPVTGARTGVETVQRTATPGEIMSNQVAQANLGINQQRLGLEREKFAHEQSKVEAPGLSKGQEALDKDFAKEYTDFVASGGIADVQKSVGQLKEAAKQLKADPTLTGSIRGLLPDSIRASTNPQAVATREAVEEITQRNLRLILGAQFTQKEGDRLIARSFNPLLSTAENAKRVERLGNQIVKSAQAKADAAAYFEKNGTLSGWKGKLPTIADFDEATTSPPPKAKSGTRFGEKPSAASVGAGRRLYDESKGRWEVSDGKVWVPE